MTIKAKNKQKGFEIKAVSNQLAVINLYADVGDWGADAEYFQKELSGVGAVENIDLHINSQGGSVVQGLAIFNQLKSHPAQITVYIDGLAASMASYIAMVGDLVVMPENAMMMIHNPRSGSYGEAKDLVKMSEILAVAKKAMIGAYVEKSGLTLDKVSEIMDNETWLTGSDAMALGFVDTLEKDIDMAAVSSFDLSSYDHPPKILTDQFISAKIDPKTLTTQTSAVADKPEKEEDIIMLTAEQIKQKALDKAAEVKAIQKATLEAEKTRKTDVKAVFAGFEVTQAEIMATCVDDMAITVEDAQKQLLASLGKNIKPMANGAWTMGKSESENKIDGFAQALQARSGLVAHDMANPFRGLTMAEMARSTLEMKGVTTSGMGKMDLVAAAFTHTSGDFGNLLSGVANKSMMKGYSETQEVFEQFCSIGSVSDFKINERVDIGTFPSLREVRAGAEFKNATMGDRKEQVKIATYGEKFSITRQAIINDDLGAFTKIPQKMGMAAKRTIGDLVFAILTSNPDMGDDIPLFDALHKNIGTGAMTSATVDALRVLMAKQKDGAAVLNILPEFMLVPTALRGTAMQIMESETEILAAKNSTARNTVRGLATVISDARLDASSATAFYLMAGQMYDAIEVSYLDGNSAPMLEQQAGWDIDGTEFKVRIDAGVSALDYKSIAKSTGA